eukprot:364340-Chlamydomonas_euryale.AAC.8
MSRGLAQPMGPPSKEWPRSPALAVREHAARRVGRRRVLTKQTRRLLPRRDPCAAPRPLPPRSRNHPTPPRPCKSPAASRTALLPAAIRSCGGAPRTFGGSLHEVGCGGAAAPQLRRPSQPTADDSTAGRRKKVRATRPHAGLLQPNAAQAAAPGTKPRAYARSSQGSSTPGIGRAGRATHGAV